MNVPFLVLSILVQWPLMIGLPIALGIWLNRRFHCGWRTFWFGALAFVLSQVVHLPLNWGLGLLGTPHGLGLLPLPLLALAAGMSAGLCEEIARYAMMRLALPRARSWSDALQFGAGHGGIEAMLFGIPAALTLVVVLFFRAVPPSTLGIGGEAAAQIASAGDALWHGAWYVPVLAGVERAAAISAHLACSVLVMRAIVRRRLGYLGAAVAAHAALDAFAVWSVRTLGVVATEGCIALAGAGFVALTLALRDPPATAR